MFHRRLVPKSVTGNTSLDNLVLCSEVGKAVFGNQYLQGRVLFIHYGAFSFDFLAFTQVMFRSRHHFLLFRASLQMWLLPSLCFDLLFSVHFTEYKLSRKA